ncbi:hypothetical protein NU10_02755 [Flavobacterium dauae]|uniref:TlpA family protein disulfide reductase n=1 Tax=Flavobacterium dauae TaxID=1563479 RepID=UPI00101BA92C|nr:hypothetical protein [Flavobacterium dauae]WLD24341.1 hypothetical protein NU10_02755 [Flavobacterium dauae]
MKSKPVAFPKMKGKPNMKILLTTLLFVIGYVEVYAQNLPKYSLDITVNLTNTLPGDTLILELIDQWTLKKHSEIKTGVSKGGNFTFHTNPVQSAGFWMLQLVRNSDDTQAREDRAITNIFFWEDQDNISLSLSTELGQLTGIKSKYKFSGTGYLKYQLKADFNDDTYLNSCFSDYRDGYFSKDFEYIREYNPCLEEQLSILDSKKKELSEIAYLSLKSDIIYNFPRSFATSVRNFIYENSYDVEKLKNNYFTSTKEIFSQDDNPYFFYSYGAVGRIQEKLMTDLRVSIYPLKNVSDYYTYLKNNTAGEARERLIVHYFANYRQSKKTDSLIADALTFFKTEEGIQELKKLEAPLPISIGKGYKFIDHNGQQFNLDSLNGKVILIDVYNPGCIPCIHLYKNVISKIKNDFRNNPDFIVLSLSVEQSDDMYHKTLATGLYTSFTDNTINVYTGAVGRRHPFLIQNKFYFNPSVLLIDKDGKTRYINNDFFFQYEKLKPIIIKLLDNK